MHLYYSGYTYNDWFESVREDVEYILKKQWLPTIEEIVDEGKLVIAFEDWKALIMEWARIVLWDEIKINPMDYYPEWWEKWDPIPSDTVHKIIAAKLWINQKFLDEALDNDGWFYFEALDKENEEWEEDEQDNYLQNLIKQLKPWELLIITKTSDKWMFKWEWTKWIPNWEWRWVNNEWDVFWWNFVDWIASGKWYVKLSEWEVFKWIWDNWVWKFESEEWHKWSVTFHIEQLAFDNIIDKLVVQKNEDWWISIFESK